MPRDDPQRFKYDVVTRNNAGRRIKIREDWLFLDDECLADPETVKNRLAQELSYSGIGVYEIFEHNPDLRPGDDVLDEVEALHTVTIAVSAAPEIGIAQSAIFVAEDEDPESEWIAVAAVGQKTTLSLESGKVTFSISEESLAANLDSWKGGYINVNHATDAAIKDMEILEAKFESPNLYFKMNPAAAVLVRSSASTGRSFEIQPLKLSEDNVVLEYAGLGLAVLYPPHNPACTVDMGCSSAANISNEPDNKSKFRDFFRGLTKFARSTPKVQINEKGKSPDTEQTMNAEDELKLRSEMSETEKGKDEALAKIAELKSELESKSTELETKETQMTEQAALLKSFQDEQVKAAEQLKEDQWDTLKSSIPKGLVHEESATAALKSEFLEDPSAFSIKLVSMLQREDPVGKSGEVTPGSAGGEVETTGIYTPGKGYAE